MKTIKIEDAESGRSISIRFDVDDMNISKLKQQLALFSVQPQDQILLIGPPYKLLETQFGPDFILKPDQRVFMYNRMIFSPGDNSRRLIPDVKLGPFEIPNPETYEDVSKELAQLHGQSTSPIFTALLVFERKFLKNLKRGETLLKFVEESMRSISKCFEEQVVQRDALNAALSHFREDFDVVNLRYEQTRQKIIDQQLAHEKILNTFDNDLESLSRIPLISTLKIQKKSRAPSQEYTSSKISEKQVVNDLQSPSYSTSPSNDMSTPLNESSRQREISLKSTLHPEPSLSLFDCVPVEKERAWAAQCRSEHLKVENTISELNKIYENVMVLVSKLNDPTVDFAILQDIIDKVKGEHRSLEDYVEQLRSSYQYVYSAVTNQASLAEVKIDMENMTILANLESKSKLQLVFVEDMEKIAERVMEYKNVVEKSKIDMTRCLFSRITIIAVIQTDIQKLMERYHQMKKWYHGKNEYFTHLEGIAKLPYTYEAFLREIVRREQYHRLLQSKISLFSENITSLRSEETSLRKEFMQTWGRYLPPVFFDMVPSLLEKPPYYNSTASDIPTLPQVSEDDISILKSYIEPGYSLANNDNTPLSKASNSNDTVPQPQNNNDSFLSAKDDSDQDLTAKYNQTLYENSCLKSKIFELTSKLDELQKEKLALNKQTNVEDLKSASATVNTTVIQKSSIVNNELMIVLFNALKTIKETIVSDIFKDVDVIKSDLPLPQQVNSDTSAAVDNEKAQRLISEILDQLNGVRNYTLKAASEIQNRNFEIQSLRDEIVMLKSGESYLQDTDRTQSILLPQERIDPKDILISVTNFVENAIVLFLHCAKGYLAFNVNCPHRYLSEESINSLKHSYKGKFPKEFIIGRIILCDRQIASAEANPFDLTIGTEYFLLTVEDLTASLNEQRTPSRKSRGKKDDKSLSV